MKKNLDIFIKNNTDNEREYNVVKAEINLFLQKKVYFGKMYYKARMIIIKFLQEKQETKMEFHKESSFDKNFLPIMIFLVVLLIIIISFCSSMQGG